MLLVVAVAFLIVTLTAYLSLLESSVLGIDDLRLATILRKDLPNRARVKKIFKRKREHLSSLVMISTLVSIAGSSSVGALAARELDSIGLAVFTALLTYCMLVFAKVLPKVLAGQMAEDIVVERAFLICFICMITKPVLGLALIWVRVLPLKAATSESSDDLRSIIRHYNKRGVIGGDQRKLAEMALALQQQTLADLLTDNEPMICLSAHARVESIEETLRTLPLKRYVVISEGEPVGVVLYRHLARCLFKGDREITVGNLIRESVVLQPETTLFEAINALHSAGASIALLHGESPESVRFVTAKQVYRALLRAS